LQRILQAPEDIEPGKRIEVQIRFWVDIDGSVSRPEIIKSGGEAFDKEVLRVMKKMPKWEPALQAGKTYSSRLPTTCNFYRRGTVKIFILPFP
jgi:protein TonB